MRLFVVGRESIARKPNGESRMKYSILFVGFLGFLIAGCASEQKIVQSPPSDEALAQFSPASKMFDAVCVRSTPGLDRKLMLGGIESDSYQSNSSAFQKTLLNVTNGRQCLLEIYLKPNQTLNVPDSEVSALASKIAEKIDGEAFSWPTPLGVIFKIRGGGSVYTITRGTRSGRYLFSIDRE